MAQKGIWLLSLSLILGLSVLAEGGKAPRKYLASTAACVVPELD